MKQLTFEEEVKLINQYATKDNFIDNGSSRAVFSIDENKVLKVALCPEGKTQIGIEVDAYEKYGDSGYLAEIISYGEHVIVSERLEPIDVDYDREEQFNKYNIQYEDYWDVIDAAEEWFGYSEDNNQVGLTPDHKLKMYDYGYNSYNYEQFELAGNLDNYDINRYIGYIPLYFKEMNIHKLKYFYEFVWRRRL